VKVKNSPFHSVVNQTEIQNAIDFRKTVSHFSKAESNKLKAGELSAGKCI